MPVRRLPEDVYPSHDLDTTSKSPHRHGRGGSRGDRRRPGVRLSTVGVFSASRIRRRHVFANDFRAFDAVDGATPYVPVAFERNAPHTISQSTRQRLLSVGILAAAHAGRCTATSQPSIFPIRHITVLVVVWGSSASTILDFSSVHVRPPADLGTPHPSRPAPTGKRRREPAYR